MQILLGNKMRDLISKMKAKLPPLPTQPPAHELKRTTLLSLSAIISVAIIAHFSIANIAIASYASLIFLLKLIIIWFNKKSPPSVIMAMLLIVGIGLVFLYYGGLSGQKTGISCITLLVSLKFLESRLIRDYYVVCLLLYFLAASSFLFNTSIINILLVVAYTIVVSALLFQISTPSKFSWRVSLTEASKIVVKALPLALFLFFFFPRLHGSFGFIPSQDTTDAPGLENSLVAGEMAAGAFNNALAFRAQFNGNTPPQNQLYWRSKVMPVERNFQWEILNVDKRDFVSGTRKSKALDLNKGQYRYEILHEASKDKFIPYLDYVSGLDRGEILDDYAVFDKKAKSSIFTYSGSATLTPSLPASINFNEAQLLNTESTPSARIQALILKWRNETNSQQELVQRAASYFNEQPFNYSLTPPLLDEKNPLDDFIFNSKTGYCEHYASAFTILMRWSGIPARVVAGYQGGKLNKSGNYIEVRYSDAHAWSEVFINGQWQRVDPTFQIRPDRIEFGMDALLELWDGNILTNATGRALSNIINPTGAARYIQQISDSWNNINYQWNKWVVNYDKNKQLQLLENLGLKHKNSLVTLVAIVAIGIALFVVFYIWQIIPKPAKLEEVQKVYHQFSTKFTKNGVIKNESDTPFEFEQKAINKLPEYSEQIQAIMRSYRDLRYGKPSEDNHEKLLKFKQQVKHFKIAKP